MNTQATRDSQLVVILDDDAMITDGLALGLEREGRTIITCNDLASAELIVERMKPSHVVSDIRLSGPFGFEGLDFVRFVRQHSPESRVVLMTGDAPDALQLEASERGAVGFLRKPFDPSELDSAIDLLTSSAKSASATDVSLIRMPLLDEILTNGLLQAYFQAIVRLGDTAGEASSYGFEALARYGGNTLLRNPEVLFQYATRKQRIEDLELACVRTSLAAGVDLARRASLFLNIHPHALCRGRVLADVIARESLRLEIPLDRIVLEITEQASLSPTPDLFYNVAHLQALGVRLAFDDVGVAYSHLPFIERLRPAFLKISQEFGTDFERDSTKTKIVMNLQSLAQDFGCDMILEGIESAATAEMAKMIGIQYGQGFFFGHPAEASSLRSSA